MIFSGTFWMFKTSDKKYRSSLRFVLITRHLNRSGYACLEHLLDAGFVPQAVIVSSNKPPLSSMWRRPFVIGFYKLKCWFYRCRPLRMLRSEELCARKNGIQIIHLASLKSAIAKEVIERLNLDLLIVAGGWHEKIPVAILQIPRYGSINVHPSMLPEFRGTSITRWQILEGVGNSGVTIHKMDADFDSGATMAQSEVAVPSNATPQSLFQQLAEASGRLLVEVLNAMLAGKSLIQKQRPLDQRYLRYFSKWKWDSCALTIDPNNEFASIHAHVLAATQESYEYPGPQLRLNGKPFMIRKASIGCRNIGDESLSSRGNIAEIDGRYLRWERLGEPHALIIEQIQPCDAFYYLRRANEPAHWFKKSEPITITAAASAVT